MKHRFSIFFLFLFFCYTGFSQSPGFERLYEHVDRNQYGLDVVQTVDGGYYLLSISQLQSDLDSFPSYNVTRTDFKGDVLWSRDYASDDLELNTALLDAELLLLDDGGFVIGVGNFGIELQKYFLRADNTGEPIWVSQYYEEGTQVGSFYPQIEMLLLTDSTFVQVVNNASSIPLVDIGITAISILDLDGNQIDAKEYILNGRDGFVLPFNIASTLDKGFITSGFIQDGSDQIAMVMKFDSLGGLQWSKEYTPSVTPGLDCEGFDVIAVTDSTYFMVGRVENPGMGVPMRSGMIAYLDSIGNPIWAGMLDTFLVNSIGDIMLKDVFPVSNETVIASGTAVDAGGVENIFSISISVDQTVNWIRLYKETDIKLLQLETIQTEDGGLAIYTRNNDNQSYFIKTDASGRTLCSEELGTGQLLELDLNADTLTYAVVDAFSRDTLEVRDTLYNGFQVPMTSLGTPSFYCEGDPIFEIFDATPSNVQDLSLVTYEWSTGETTATITVTDEEQYTVEVTINEDYCFTLCDTIQVNTQGPPTAGIDVNASIFCLEGEAFFTATGGDDYLWSTGETTETITVTDTETYEVTVTDVCGSSTISAAFVIPEIRADLVVNSATFCQDSIVTIILDTNAPGGDIDWSTGDEDVLFVNVLAEGPYDVSVSTPFCGGATASTEVVFPTEPMDLVVSLDTSAFCRDSVFNISASATNADQLIWVDDVIGDFRPDVDPGTYTVVASNECGDSEPATITVGSFLCPLEGDCLAIPNIFTPNEDGRNDAFGAFIQPACEPLLQTYHLRIYSRWGQLIFESFENGARWDGTKDGNHQPADVYNYILTYSFLNGQAVAEEAARGEVVLVR